MENKRLAFEVSKVDITKLDDSSFLGIKLWAIAEGVCRNYVDFKLEAIENCIPTVYNKPILAAFNKKKDEFEGHNDNGVKIDDNGEIYIDYDPDGFLDGIIEKPVGLIPLNSDVKIEKYKSKNWLTFNGLIWVKYSHNAVKLLKKLGKERISVEITLTDWEETDDGIIIVKAFIFDGVTIIGVPEGIEGAHLKVGDFAQSEDFSKFQKALMFAYEKNKQEVINKEINNEMPKPPENIEEGGKDEKMKFDFKGMGLNTFRDKIWNVLKDYVFDYEYVDCDGKVYSYKCHKYWMFDVFPDDNYVILEDCEEERLLQVHFTIDDDRNIILDFINAIVVELEVAEVTYKTKFDFQPHRVVQENNIQEGEDVVMDVKFKTSFIEKGFTPVCKYDKFILFVKKDEEGNVYKLESSVIDECSDEQFGELLSKFEKMEEKSNEDMVSKLEFESIVAEKEKIEAERNEIKEKCSTLEKELNETKTQLQSVNEKFAEFEFNKFKEEARAYVEHFSKSFGEEKDIFKQKVFEKIENKEIKDFNALKSFVGELLVDYNENKLKETDKNFNLVTKKTDVVLNDVKDDKKGVLTWLK